MDTLATANLATVRAYLAALSAGASDEETLAFLAPDVAQVEYPNRIVDTGARRGLAELRAAAARGRQAVRRQAFIERHAVAQGDQVFIEVLWEGELAVPAGALAPGDTMRAHCAIALELRDGKIVQQRNYDCFEPFRPAA